MKRIPCPKCSNYITFDEKRYSASQTLAFTCPNCGKKFAIRLGKPKFGKQIDDEDEEEVRPEYCGSIVVIENVFHYKQIIPLTTGDNIIGRDMKDARVNCPIKTNDPSIDITHCVINISRDKNGKLKYVLRDGPSYTGTFVDNEILGDREKRIISDGTLFTIGATSVILKTDIEDPRD